MVGGLPEVIASFAKNDLEGLMRIKQGLLDSYREDFAKYASKAQQHRMRLIFNTVPKILGEKFKYSNISREDKSTVIKESLDKLTLANIINVVTHTDANGLPLGAELNEKYFKSYFLDIGLVSSVLNLNIIDFVANESLILVNNGKIAEQFVAQHLWYFREPYEVPKLYYWSREQKSAAAEIDFIISFAGKIIPIEVKAGAGGSLKSLHYFMQTKHSDLGVRFCTQLPSFHPEYKLLSLPLYLIEELGRIITTI